jgi:biopolymer transport protein ExbB/TolQ
MLLTSVCLLLVIASGTLLFKTIRQYRLTNRQVIALRSRALRRQSKIQKKRLDLLETRNRNKVLEDTVKSGTAAVEKMHRTLTNATFGLIDRFSSDDEFRENARKARETHDQTSDKIYKTLHTTNKAVHLLADTLLTRRTESRIRRRYSRRNDQD